jgi:NADH-quinone oxidoreductase subunit K
MAGEYGLLLAAILFCLGAAGVLLRRNLIFVLLSLEIMMNSAGLAFVAAGRIHGSTEGGVMFLMILAVAAAEVAIGLALAVLIYQRYRTLDLAALARVEENHQS